MRWSAVDYSSYKSVWSSELQGYIGYSGAGLPGYSGYIPKGSGFSGGLYGYSGFSGYSGYSGTSGWSGSDYIKKLNNAALRKKSISYMGTKS